MYGTAIQKNHFTRKCLLMGPDGWISFKCFFLGVGFFHVFCCAVRFRRNNKKAVGGSSLCDEHMKIIWNFHFDPHNQKNQAIHYQYEKYLRTWVGFGSLGSGAHADMLATQPPTGTGRDVRFRRFLQQVHVRWRRRRRRRWSPTLLPEAQRKAKNDSEHREWRNCTEHLLLEAALERCDTLARVRSAPERAPILRNQRPCICLRETPMLDERMAHLGVFQADSMHVALSSFGPNGRWSKNVRQSLGIPNTSAWARTGCRSSTGSKVTTLGSSGTFEMGQRSPCAVIRRKASSKASFLCFSSRRSVTEL